MNFCENCGEKLTEGSKFCENCGAVVENESEDTSIPDKQKKDMPKVVLTKIQKIAIGGLVGLGVLSFVGYKIGENVYSQENQTEALIETLSGKDPKKIAEVLHSNDPNFEITAETMEPFVDYLENNPNYLNALVNELQFSNTYDSFEIKKDSKHLFFFDKYELFMEPVYAHVITNVDGAKIYNNDEEFLTSDSDDFKKEIGPLAPGTYEFSVEGVVNNNTLSSSTSVSLIDSDTLSDIDLTLQGTYFEVQSDLNDAVVYVDEEEIGQLEDGMGSFGPMQVESGQMLHVEKSFGEETISSDPVELSDYDNTYYFDDLVVADKNDLATVIQNMYKTVSFLTRNYNESDVSEFNSYFAEESSAYKEQRKQFIDFAKEIDENDDVTKVRFEAELQDYKQTDINTFDVKYEVTYITDYKYNLNKNSKIRHYSKDMIIEFESTNNPYKDYDALIKDISNETLIYEEGGEDN